MNSGLTSELWLAVLVIAIGTFALRVLPTLWMQRHLAKQQSKNALNGIPQWLSLLGPMMIAAITGVSLVPPTPSDSHWLAAAVGLVLTLVVWRQTRSLGLPVILGVLGYALITVGLRS